jgi:hypothetical protein
MKLPPTLMDPIAQHELAESLHMTVAELLYGRGAPTPIREIAIEWPTYRATKQRMENRARFKAEQEGERQRRHV